MSVRAYWLRVAALVVGVFTVLAVLDFGYGVPWLVRAPIAFLAGFGVLDLWEIGRKWWHERARRNRLR